MGMFDNLKCLYPLPVDGVNALDYQTQDIQDWPTLDNYEIREDGTLWHQVYDTEDQSDRGKWLAEHPGEPEPEFPLSAWCGCMARINPRWVPEPFTGDVNFYDLLGDPNGKSGWIEFRASFADGALKDIQLVEHRPVNALGHPAAGGGSENQQPASSPSDAPTCSPCSNVH